MATKYIRIIPKSTNTVIQNLYGSNRFIRKNYKIDNFKIKSSDYSDGDDIEIRVAGARQIMFATILDETGDSIEYTISSYSKGDKDSMSGMKIKTSTITTATTLNVFICSNVGKDSSVIYANVEST